MLLILVLISQVGCEWVEISQQHYRKPVRKTPNYATENAENSKIYTNDSISEHNWNTGAVHRVPNLGNVKRVQIPVSNGKLSMNHSIETDRNGFGNVGVNEGRVRNEDMVGSVERVSNIGKVNRVQLADAHVKSPAVKIQPGVKSKEERPKIPSKVKLENKDTESSDNERKYTDDVSYFGNKNQMGTESISNLTTLEVEKEILRNAPDFTSGGKTKYEPKNFTLIKFLNEPTPTFVTESDEFYYNDKVNSGAFGTNTKFKEANHNGNLIDAIETTEFGVPAPITSEMQVSQSRIKIKNVQHPNFVTKGALSEGHTTKHELGYGITQDNFNTKPLEENPNKNQHNERVNDFQNKINPDVTGNTKTGAIDTLVNLMKIVTDTISKNTRRNVNSKMRYLLELKDTILANIEDRIDATWPDDNDEGPSRRRSRSTRGTARGHVEFPSSESALMTISFLTFAVFLIKLVLQVIQTYKDKTMMVAPLVVATAGRAARNLLQPKL